MSAGIRKSKSRQSTAFTIPRLTPQVRYNHKVESILIALGEHDFHGVQDFASDLRELVAAYPELREHEARLWSRRKA